MLEGWMNDWKDGFAGPFVSFSIALQSHLNGGRMIWCSGLERNSPQARLINNSSRTPSVSFKHCMTYIPWKLQALYGQDLSVKT